MSDTTAETARRAAARAKELGIKHLVVASNTGTTALTLAEAVDQAYGPDNPSRPSISCVTHVTGFRNPGEQEMPEEVRERLHSMGIKVLTTTHLMGGIERAIAREWGGLYPAAIVANTLRMFGQGSKVAVECAVMALDSGLIPYGEEVISLGGSGRGADTALVVRPSHAASFFKTAVLEVVTKPRKGAE